MAKLNGTFADIDIVELVPIGSNINRYSNIRFILWSIVKYGGERCEFAANVALHRLNVGP